MFWYWLFVAPAIVLAFFSLRGEGRRAKYAASRLSASDHSMPPVTLIVPVKGEDEGLRENLAALASLDYPDYELIVAARQAADIPHNVLPSHVRVVLSHAAESETSEKVQNLLAAVRVARKRSEVFAFADSDGRPTKRWLQALVAPLSEPGVGAVTGYRWFLPEPADFPSLLRAVWDSVAAGMLGPGDNPFVWGGAMAIRKEVFFRARVPDCWDGEINDDYALAEAVHGLPCSLAFAPGALTPAREHTSFVRFFSWSRRQMAMTRLYSPRLWWPGLVSHIFYCTAMTASALFAARGYLPAIGALVLQLAPGMWKGRCRARLARRALPEHESWFRRCGWAHWLLVPFATWAWLLAFASSALLRRIEWRGRLYELKRPR